MAQKHDTVETVDEPRPRGRTALATPLLGIVLGVVGTLVMAYSFVNGISAALDASGNGAGLYVGLFFGGAVLALIAIIIGIVGLIRGGHRILSFLSLLIGLVPAAVIAVIAIVNLASIGGPRP